MSVPAKLRRLLGSSPSTSELADFLEVIEAEGYDDTEVKASISALETAVGKATGDGAGGIAKDVADLKTAVGDNTAGLTKDVATVAGGLETVEAAIGTESTEGTILARIKALEDASNEAQ